MLDAPTPPVPPVPLRKRGPAAGPLLARKLRALDAELARALPRVLKGDDDEAIHDLRVAIRQLRTLLKLARPVYGRFHADAVRAAFTVVHRSTGALRDEEVLEEILAGVVSDAPSFVAWKMRRQSRERALRRRVVGGLRTGDLARARRLLKALLTLPVDPARDRPSPKLARRAVEGARRRVERLRDAPTEDGVALHDLRIAYKELRYAAELLSDALPSDLAAMALPASKFQKRLGEIHDADMALVALKRARGLDLATRAQVLGSLEALRAKRVAKYVAEMAPHAEEPEASDPSAMAGALLAAAVTPSASSRSGRSRPS